jgi:hypothetical protein
VISRRRLLTGLVLAWAPLAAAAQEYKAGKVYRIGVLEPTSMALNVANLDAFRQGLRELGYVEGRNMSMDATVSAPHSYVLILATG